MDFTGRGKMRDALGIIVERQLNAGDEQRRSYTERLFQWLCTQQIRLVVSIGPSAGRLTLATGRRCNVRCRDYGTDEYHIHFEHEAGDKSLLFSGNGEQDPVLVPKVPATEVEKPDGSLDIKLRIEAVEVRPKPVANKTPREEPAEATVE